MFYLRMLGIVISNNTGHLITFDKLNVTIHMNNNFKLPLLRQIYHLHLFLFQIQKIKHNKKRSDQA